MHQLGYASRVFAFLMVLAIFIPLVNPVNAKTNRATIGLVFEIKGSSSEIILEGTSTMLDWSCESSRVEGFVNLPLRLDAVPAIRGMLRKGKVDDLRKKVGESLRARPRGLLWIPVRSFQCDNSRMTRDMQSALKKDTYPYVIFQYNRFRSINFPVQGTGQSLEFGFSLTGGLAMAGSANTVNVASSVEERDDEAIRLTGELNLRMTEFNIVPPTALMGLVKAHDPVTVKYTITARPIRDPGVAQATIQNLSDTYSKLMKPLDKGIESMK